MAATKEAETENSHSQLLSNGNPTTNGIQRRAGKVDAEAEAQADGTDGRFHGGYAGLGIDSKGPPTTGTFMKLKTYLLALRPWSLSASLVPTLLGSALAYRSQWSAEFSLATFFLTAFTVVTVHCAGNVVNTYFDFIKGIDKQKADDRTLVDHILTKDEVSASSEEGIGWIINRKIQRNRRIPKSTQPFFQKQCISFCFKNIFKFVELN